MSRLEGVWGIPGRNWAYKLYWGALGFGVLGFRATSVQVSFRGAAVGVANRPESLNPEQSGALKRLNRFPEKRTRGI